jgi:hypothetical protein
MYQMALACRSRLRIASAINGGEPIEITALQPNKQIFAQRVNTG